MARFSEELPSDLIKQIKELETDSEHIFGDMLEEAGSVVYANIIDNMQGVFDSFDSLLKGLKITKVYHTPSDDAINIHIGFYGYKEGSKATKRHPKGTPIPLIAMAREYGTSKGEAKKPFLRKSFKRAEIERALNKVQDRYIGD